MISEKRRSFISSAALVLVAAIWGFAFVIVKDTLDFVGPVWMVAIRFSIAAAVLALICIPRYRRMSRKILIHGSLLGLFLFLAYLTQTIGCKYTTPGRNAFITTLYVILVPLLGWPVLRKRPSWFVWLAAVMSVSGIGLIALNSENGSLSVNIGDFLTMICGIFYAVHIVFGAKYVADEDPVLLTLLQFVVCGILGFIISPFIDEPLTAQALFKAPVIVSLLYLALLSSLLCFLLQNICLKYVQPALASLFLGLESVFGVFFSIICGTEIVSVKMIVGCVLIFGAIIVAEVIPNMHKNTNS